MTDRRSDPPFHARPVYRLVSGVFGLCLVGVGVYALFFVGPPDALQSLGGAVLMLLGGNMLLAACRARESWLSRIGPLP
jgi:uncharacterized membrane protein HdeD (DUF308 family)